MDFANRGNRPTQAPRSAGSEDSEQIFQPSGANKSKGSSKAGLSGLTKIAAIFLLFATSILIIAALFGLVFGGDAGKDESALIDKSKYQAVFLNSQDGQVYFGRLEVYNSKLYRLTDIFYVRVEQALQPESETQQTQANISLAKLGNELHGPEDAMFIARDKVLYWENLKNDGQVVTAITEFIKNGRQTPQNDQQQTQETPTTPTTPTETTPTEGEGETPTP